MAGVTGKGAPRRRRVKAEASPTTPDPLEIAMAAEVGDKRPHPHRLELAMTASRGFVYRSEPR